MVNTTIDAKEVFKDNGNKMTNYLTLKFHKKKSNMCNECTRLKLSINDYY